MSDIFFKELSSRKNWQKELKKLGKKSKIELKRGHSKHVILERWKAIIKKNKKYQKLLKERNEVEDPTDPFYKGVKDELLTERTFFRSDLYKNNIENFIGCVKVPLGIAGPIKVKGLFADGAYFVPLATTEAALVASYNRGISAVNMSGGCRSCVILEGVNRDPTLIFLNLVQVGEFYLWAKKSEKKFKEISERTTRHGKLVKLTYMIDNNTIFMKFVYTTGDASGQNMTTIATQAVVEYIEKNSPIKPVFIMLEGGRGCDKKATFHHTISCRGRKVCTVLKFEECTIPKDVCISVFNASPERIYWGTEVVSRGYHYGGTIGLNAHYANGLAALAIALGLDPATVSEGHIGMTRVDLTKEGDLYVSCTMPNILCATVGGGTSLPTSRACLTMMGLFGPGKAKELAEVIGAVLLAGELSLGAAMLNGNFAKAHQILARDTNVLTLDPDDTIDEKFLKVQAFLVKLSRFPDRKVMLEIYALYKQSTVGDINIPKPGLIAPIKAKKKYDAWKAKQGTKKDEAKQMYIDLCMDLYKKDVEICKKESKLLEKKIRNERTVNLKQSSSVLDEILERHIDEEEEGEVKEIKVKKKRFRLKKFKNCC